MLRELLARKRELQSSSSIRLKDYSEMTPEQSSAMEAWIDEHGRLNKPKHAARVQCVLDTLAAALEANGGRFMTGRPEDVDYQYWK